MPSRTVTRPPKKKRHTHTAKRHATPKPSTVAQALLDDTRKALSELLGPGAPVEPSSDALTAVFGSINWRLVGHDVSRSIFEIVINAIDKGCGEEVATKALTCLGNGIQLAMRDFRRVRHKHALAESLSVFLRPEAAPAVETVIRMCRAGYVRAGAKS